ncbi:MAG: hypothetical protein ACREDT_07505 [Methylocella sp.]
MAPFLQVGGEWDIVQNNGFRVRINVTQDRDRLSAFAPHPKGSVQSAEAKGFVRGPDIEMTITWDNGTKDLYTGKLTHGLFPDSGLPEGSYKGPEQPWKRGGWESDGRVFHVA